MVETTVASNVVNWIATMPQFYQDLKLVVGCILLAVSAVSAALAVYQGVGTAIGKLVGGCVLAAVAFSGLSLIQSIDITANNHSGTALFNDTEFLPPGG
jgi:hypothetical protein